MTDKIIKNYNILTTQLLSIEEYINALCSLPPQGDGAKEQVVKEVKELFKVLNAQSKSLEIALISAIYEKEKTK